MYLLFDSLKNIVRYKNRYLLNGLFLAILSFIGVTVYLALDSYKQTLLKIQKHDFIVEPYDSSVSISINLLTNRIYLFDTAFWVILFIGIFTITIVVVLCLIERKYDMGVLLSMGMGRIKLSLFLLFEMEVFVFSSIILGMIPAHVFCLKLLFALDGLYLEVSTFVSINSNVSNVIVLHIVILAMIIPIISTLGTLSFILRHQVKILINNK